MTCSFCQNYQISQNKPKTEFISFDRLLKLIDEADNNIGVAFTYNEPMMWYEYIYDACRKIKEHNSDINVVIVTNGYINEKIVNGKKVFILTNKGKLRYESLRERKNKRWDGKWRIVSFDVYEKNRKKRDLLRRELQAYGFQMMHQSMWVYPYPCDEYVALLKSDLSFGKNVQYMLVDYVDMHMELKRMFDL